MRKITFWLTLALIFTIPWEDTFRFSVGTGSSFTRLFGLGVAGLWFLTIVVEGRFLKPTSSMLWCRFSSYGISSVIGGLPISLIPMNG